jgi:hypothetical protein
MQVQTTFANGVNPFARTMAAIPSQSVRDGKRIDNPVVKKTVIEWRKLRDAVYEYVHAHHGCTVNDVAIAMDKSPYHVGGVLRRGVEDGVLSRSMQSKSYARAYVYAPFGAYKDTPGATLINRVYEYIEAHPGTSRTKVKKAFPDNATVGAVLCYMVNQRRAYYVMDADGDHYYVSDAERN